ncbi:MAG: polysaccharide lyase, partial [Pseudomonadota bacterium]|nr:polysaccharide lyase [Pseudomonadota bacterium]
KSRYTDWVVRIKLSTGQDGAVEVTKDGNRVVSYHGRTNVDGNPPAYVIWGAYSPRNSKKPSGDGRVTVYYDSVSISGR